MNLERTARRWTVIALAVLSAGLLNAGDATWAKTAAGATYDWTNVVNWLPNTTFPNGAGQVADITNDIAGVQEIRLRQNITLGTLNIGDAVASANNYGIKILAFASETLTFDSGVPGVAAKVNTGNSGTPTVTLQASMALNSDLRVTLGGTDSANRPRLAFNGVTAMNGHSLTFTNGVSGQDQISIAASADFTGGGTIINNAQVPVAVTGGKAFGGTLVANRSTFGLTLGGFTNVVECVVNGWLSNTTARIGGGLDSGNNAAQVANPGQRFPRHRITLNGGSVSANSQLAATNALGVALWQDWVRDDVAVLDFKSGYNYVAVYKAANVTGTVFAAGTVLRSRGVSAFLFRKYEATNCLFRADNGLSLLTGAGGTAGSTTMSIVPWMGVSLSGATTPNGFATYEEETGFRPLAATEYTNSLIAGATHNFGRGDAPPALSADAAVNSLRMVNAFTYNMGTNRTLTLASGGLFMENTTLGASGNTNAGTVNFGTAEGIISVHGVNAATIGARITGTGGLTKANTGTLTLAGANSYSGTNHIGGGTLRVGVGTYASNLGSGNVEVHAGATLQLSCADAIADTASVKLYSIGQDMYYGKLYLDEGINETVRYLYLGEEGMPSGTYGATGSGAAISRDGFFSGTGVLTVSGSATAIHHGTLIRIL